MEVNFGISNDIEKLKQKQKTLISQVDARMQSRFMKGTKLPTLQIIASSKASEQSFLETYIDLKRRTESKTTLIIDEPQWIIRNDKDSPIKFWVAIGNKFMASEVLPKDAPESLVEEYRNKGYNMLHVPIGYYQAFIENVDIALTDIAGISTSSSTKFISGIKWNEIKNKNYQNPFSREILEIGNAQDDIAQYYDFFDMTKIDRDMLSKPLFIHLDMSISGDKTGIAGTWIKGKIASGDPDLSRELYFKTAFSVSIKAPKGHQVSFEKNRQFIRWLRRQGFNIRGVSSDTFQAAQLQQQLIADGFNVSTISVDRLQSVDADAGALDETGATVSRHRKICLPYQFLKTAIYEHKLEIYDKCDFLTEEIVGLEKEADGHINHPENGTQGCFTGDTCISLADGREVALTDLVAEYAEGKENFVYSFNEETRRIEPKRILKAWKTIENANLVQVTLDNGEQIKCTPNHLFMLRDGSYCAAEDLLPGESLMPLYRKYSYSDLSIKCSRIRAEQAIDHKVILVEVLSERADVYDLTIEDNHNFALSCGIFVHNSKDQADALCGSVWAASQHAEEFAYDYGESAEHLLAVNEDYGQNEQQFIAAAFEQNLIEQHKVINPFEPTLDYSLYDDIVIL